MADPQSGTTPPEPSKPRNTRPILIAGILGGLLGGLASFGASQFIKPSKPEKPPSAKEMAIADARERVEMFIDLLKGEKIDQFMDQLKRSYTFMSDEDYGRWKQNLANSRLEYLRRFGQPTHQFDLLQESALSPNLVQFDYLERFDHGAVIWRFVMYQGVEHWRVAFAVWTLPS